MAISFPVGGLRAAYQACRALPTVRYAAMP
jgi:hypothetical protein